MDDTTAAAERSNLIERMAEAILYAWMHVNTGPTMPDRTAADYALDSQEWADFWQSLGISQREKYRAQAEAALEACELLEQVETLEKRIEGAQEALFIPYPSTHDQIDSAVGLAKRYLRGGFDDVPEITDDEGELTKFGQGYLDRIVKRREAREN